MGKIEMMEVGRVRVGVVATKPLSVADESTDPPEVVDQTHPTKSDDTEENILKNGGTSSLHPTTAASSTDDNDTPDDGN